MSEPARFGWLPAFFVGVATAIAAEVSGGLLLYTGEGLLRATTLLLATLLAAFALGLWAVPRWDGEGVIALIRRRWLVAFGAYAIGAATAAAWTMMGGLASSGFTRGVGLALLAGAPMYGSGLVLAAMSGGGMVSATSIGAAAAGGAAVGVIVTGWVLFPSLGPVAMYVVPLIALTAGAAVHATVLAGRSEFILVDEEPSLFGLVRVYDRVWDRPLRTRRVLTVGGRIAGGTENGQAFRSWERALSGWAPEYLNPNGERPDPVLLLGASAVGLQSRIRESGAPLTVVERNPVVWRMTVRHLGEPRVAEGMRVETGAVCERVLDEVGASFAMVVSDGGGWEGGLNLPSANVIGKVRRVLRPGGVFVVGGDDPDVLGTAEAAGDVRDLFRAAGFTRLAGFISVDERRPGRLVLMAGVAETSLPDRLPRMTRVAMPEDVG